MSSKEGRGLRRALFIGSERRNSLRIKHKWVLIGIILAYVVIGGILGKFWEMCAVKKLAWISKCFNKVCLNGSIFCEFKEHLVNHSLLLQRVAHFVTFLA